ncbi:MAG: DNA-3-methyladenine glycosylase [Labilithrix sp.]|nr:DNA-3-methyladenine glycosylase [Labilithrix sp.]MCW5814296.1 DNA-3-methyladenine glycosylase [Labilithrix sp.]
MPRAFFARDALVLARALIGTRLVVRSADHVQIARITETEAYRGPKDLACHARAGLTRRTRTLFGPPGHAYVFLIYGMYDCFNVVGDAEGRGHAVLVRAVEPVTGMPPGVSTAGPGRLTRALGITRKDDTADLADSTSRIYIAARTRRPRLRITPRVGVAYAGEWATRPWRFLDADTPHVSRPPARSIGLG